MSDKFNEEIDFILKNVDKPEEVDFNITNSLAEELDEISESLDVLTKQLAAIDDDVEDALKYSASDSMSTTSTNTSLQAGSSVSDGGLEVYSDPEGTNMIDGYDSIDSVDVRIEEEDKVDTWNIGKVLQNVSFTQSLNTSLFRVKMFITNACQQMFGTASSSTTDETEYSSEVNISGKDESKNGKASTQYADESIVDNVSNFSSPLLAPTEILHHYVT